MCAIRCRLFLLGYSSHIGFTLAYAFRPASGAAYSSSPRAPSPRVPPVAPCARRRWQNVMYAIAADPTNECGRRSMSPASPAGDICIGRVVGALLAYGRRLSLPSRRFPASPLPPESPATPFPCARRPCSSVCANAHPNGVRASGGRARPATLLNCAGFPHSLAFHPLRGSLRSPLRKRFPAPLVGSAALRPRHASPRAGIMKRAGVTDDSASRVNTLTRQ